MLCKEEATKVLNTIGKDVKGATCHRIAARAKLPPLPGIPRRTEEERVAYGIEPPLRGTGFTRLLDLLGLAISKGSIGNPIPAEFNGKLVDMKEKARESLIAADYSERRVLLCCSSSAPMPRGTQDSPSTSNESS